MTQTQPERATARYARTVDIGVNLSALEYRELAGALRIEAHEHESAGRTGLATFARDRARDCDNRAAWVERDRAGDLPRGWMERD